MKNMLAQLAKNPMTYVLGFALSGVASIVAGVGLLAGPGFALIAAGIFLLIGSWFIAKGMTGNG